MTPQQNPRKLVKYEPRKLSKTGRPMVPALIADAGERAGQRFLEFFTAEIRNRNTRLAYGRAVLPFLKWCEAHVRRAAGTQTRKPTVLAESPRRSRTGAQTSVGHAAREEGTQAQDPTRQTVTEVNRSSDYRCEPVGRGNSRRHS